MKVAIIGSSLSGLACAIALERSGIIPDIFERDSNIGWIWPSVGYIPSFYYRDVGDIRHHLLEEYRIDIKPLTECRKIIMKSAKSRFEIDGELGYFNLRGKSRGSLEDQMSLDLKKTAIACNRAADYKELCRKYDWVVVATGNDSVARELGVWKDEGIVHIVGSVALGHFDYDATTIFFNTEYAGTGYARVTPFHSEQAIVSLYIIGKDNIEPMTLYSRFIKAEGLEKLEQLYRIQNKPFTTGSVKKFQVGNILFAGAAAGLVERLTGVGAPEAVISGTLAAKAIANNLDYGKLVKPLKNHVESISSFRKAVDKFSNNDFDNLLSVLGTPGIKQILYNSRLNLVEKVGSIFKQVYD